MTLFQYLEWRIVVMTDRLTQRLKSEHATIREHAQEHQHTAKLYRLLRDTDASLLNAEQRIWLDFVQAMCATMQNNPRMNAAQNSIDRDSARKQRDAALAALTKERAA